MKYLSLEQEDEITKQIKNGSIFIYPTDTVYGIGCNATIPKSVKKLRTIKNTTKPLSVIAPSFDWIKKNMKIKNQDYLLKLPGPYTLIIEKKKKEFLKEVSDVNLGIRVPNHPITHLITKAGVPFITTSANVTGEKTIKQIQDIPKKILDKIDFVIDGGLLDNKPSEVIDLTKKEPETIRSSKLA